MRSHGSAEWSEDYPWYVVLGILPRSGRPIVTKVPAGCIAVLSSEVRHTMGLPLRGSSCDIISTGCTRFARFTRGYAWRTLRVQYGAKPRVIPAQSWNPVRGVGSFVFCFPVVCLSAKSGHEVPLSCLGGMCENRAARLSGRTLLTREHHPPRESTAGPLHCQWSAISCGSSADRCGTKAAGGAGPDAAAAQGQGDAGAAH